MMEASKKVVEDRQANPIYFSEDHDLLGLMLDHTVDDKTHGKINESKDSFKGNFKKMITAKEVQMNIWLFLLAGSETSSTALGFIAHALCQSQEIQDRLSAEIRSQEEAEGGELSFDVIHKMAYLDAVIQEALRMYPPAPSAIRRQTADEIQLKAPSGYIQVPKGLTIQVGVLATHFNPVLWSRPTEFDPARFASEARKGLHPFQFLPFGLGPRGCVGMRFAMMEIKMALVELVRNFRIKPCAASKTEIEFDEGATRTPKNGVWVKLESRKECKQDPM